MDERGQKETVEIKAIQGASTHFQVLRIDRGGKQVDGIPEAVLAENAVETGEHGHGHAARESALDACGDGIGFEWKQGARELRSNVDALNFAAGGGDGNNFFFNGNFDVLFVRENVEEPADTSGNEENGAEDEDGEAGDESCNKQCEAEGQGDGPGGGRRHEDVIGRGTARFRW